MKSYKYIALILVVLSLVGLFGCGSSSPSIINLAGQWVLTMTPIGGIAGVSAPMFLAQDGSTVTGSVVSPGGTYAVNGIVAGNLFSGTIGMANVTAQITTTSMTGNSSNPSTGISATLTAIKTSSTARVLGNSMDLAKKVFGGVDTETTQPRKEEAKR